MYNIDTLAQLTGLTRRTIRYYVQRGVLDPPKGGGRGSYYTEQHKAQLEQVKILSDQGVPLIHMRSLLEGRKLPEDKTKTPNRERNLSAAPGGSMKSSESYERLHVAAGVEIHFVAGRLQEADLEEIQGLIRDLVERREHVD